MGRSRKRCRGYLFELVESWLKPAFERNELTLAALAKKYGTIPVIANGNLEDPDKAEQLLILGEADLITLGKGALANHDCRIA